MSIQVYGIPNCGTCKKAFAWLQNNNIEYEFVNTKENPPSKEMIASWVQNLTSKPMRNSCLSHSQISTNIDYLLGLSQYHVSYKQSDCLAARLLISWHVNQPWLNYAALNLLAIGIGEFFSQIYLLSTAFNKNRLRNRAYL